MLAQIVDAFRAGRASEGDLYRAIMEHAAWRVTGTVDADGQHRLGVLSLDSGRILELFSSDSTLEAFAAREAVVDDAGWIELPGYRLFSMLSDGVVDRVNLDLHSPHGMHFWGNQLAMLRSWAEVVAVELALRDPDRFANPWDVLRRFGHYHLVFRVDGNARELVLAPDGSDRSLGAVFTAPDAADAFIEAARPALGDALEVTVLDGRSTFEALSRMQLDGVVFNPLTPLKPVALSAAAFERLLG